MLEAIRAKQFLESEAKQLPKDLPGLIVVQVSHALGAFKTWEPILQRRLQPNLHTRVTNVTLSELAAGERSEGRGEYTVTDGHSRCECSDPAQKKFRSARQLVRQYGGGLPNSAIPDCFRLPRLAHQLAGAREKP
jgi:hypothetical protein